jgi:hypothetical protein
MSTIKELIDAIEIAQCLVDGEINDPDRHDINSRLDEVIEIIRYKCNEKSEESK